MQTPRSWVSHASYAKQVARTMASQKVHRFLYEHYVMGRPFPFSLTLNVTTGCNLACAYCDIPRGPREEPPLDLLVRLVRALGDRTVHFNLTGGEPLLREDLGELVDTIQGLPAPTYLTMFTNGKRVRARRDVMARVDEAFISLDGGREHHDRRRGAGAFDGAMDAMSCLAEMGKAYSATCVVTRGTERELDFLFGHASRHGYKIGFIPVRVYSRSPAAVTALEPSPQEMRRVIDRVRRFEQTSNSPAGLDQLAAWPRMPPLDRPCKGGMTFFTLEADGRLYRCCERRPEHQVPETIRPERVMDFVARLPREPCLGCWNIEGMELTRMFSLQPRALYNLFRQARTSHVMRRAHGQRRTA